MPTFHLTSTLFDAVTGSIAGQDTLWVEQSVLNPIIAAADDPIFVAGLLMSFALALAIRRLGKPIAGPVVQIAARALVYLLERLRDIIIDRLLEALIIALIAVMAGVSWFGDIPAMLDKMFH